jgi:hypothetical protein
MSKVISYNNVAGYESKELNAVLPIQPGAKAKTALATVGAGAITAAMLVSGLLMRTGPTGAYADTTDTATQILAALDSPAVGDSWDFFHVNGVAYICTFTAGAGVTLEGVTANAASKVRMYRITITGIATPAILITGIGELVA